MSKDRGDAIQNILEKVNPSRRGFLKQVLMGGGVVAALAVPASYVQAQEKKEGQGSGSGSGSGSGKKKKKKAADDEKKNGK
jgi:hypothetical protein